MCIGDEDLSCKRINTFITIIWTQSCLLLSDDVCLKEIATTDVIADINDILCKKINIYIYKKKTIQNALNTLINHNQCCF